MFPNRLASLALPPNHVCTTLHSWGAQLLLRSYIWGVEVGGRGQALYDYSRRSGPKNNDLPNNAGS